MVTLSVLVGVASAVGGHLLWSEADSSDTAQVAGPSSGLERQPPEPSPTASAGHPGGPGAETPASPAPATASVSLPDETPTTTTVDPAPPTRTSSSQPTTTPSEDSTTPTTSAPTSGSGSTSPTTGPTTTTGDRTDQPLEDLAQYVNEERVLAGCSPARVAPELGESAEAHSDDMSRQGRLSHNSSDGTSFEERVESHGYDDPAAENLAMGVTSARAVVDNWMAQDAHSANITDCDVTALGVGLNENGWYWTLDLGY
nr:CAP domain-containing protein [Prauserella isguenensis]